MKAVLTLAAAFMRTSLRERNALFWFWLFPLVLLGLLGAIFGAVERGELHVDIALVNGDSGPLGHELIGFLHSVIGENARFVYIQEGNGEERLASVREDVEEARVHAALLIPPEFSRQMSAGIPTRIEILYRRGEAGSSTAASLLAEALEEFGRNYLFQSGGLAKAVEAQTCLVGGEARTVSYVEFVLPGVIIMAFFIAGIFNVPNAIVFAKEVGILKRYLATPLLSWQYFFAFFLSALFLSLLQGGAVWALGRFAFGTRLPLLRPASLAFLLLAFATSVALGLLISALAHTHQGAMALANLFNLPLQFLGGLYFPITSLPKPLQILMAVNPLTHLAEGLRAALGLSARTFPAWANFLVPLLWLGVSVFLAVRRIHILGET
ncbi:MAG: ABC transporter permease [Candidatus Bipolaricaulota bacterium]|nr:ABC transporter permease [Candidatus Bipolaricaulota bacterium]MDW8126837.1 ABC transporter permease [Candidatus Bipolaricaulota bacterium]